MVLQAGKAIHTSVECLDPVVERWELQSADLLCGRKYCSVAALGGALTLSLWGPIIAYCKDIW